MSLSPDYGGTRLSLEEISALRVESDRELSRSQIYAAETDLAVLSFKSAMAELRSGRLAAEDILDDYFLRKMHENVFGSIWTWAGKYRTRQTNIGVSPENIAVDVRMAMDDVKYLITNEDEYRSTKAGILLHAKLVTIHPFVDGNGRTTRLLGDLLTFAITGAYFPYMWDVDKAEYIQVLRDFECSRDPQTLFKLLGQE